MPGTVLGSIEVAASHGPSWQGKIESCSPINQQSGDSQAEAEKGLPWAVVGRALQLGAEGSHGRR